MSYTVSLLPALFLFISVTINSRTHVVPFSLPCHYLLQQKYSNKETNKKHPYFYFFPNNTSTEGGKKIHRRAPKQFSQWICLLSVTVLEMLWEVSWPVSRCVCLVLQGSPLRTKHQQALCLPVELIILDHFILLTEGRDRLGVMNGYCYTLPDHPGAHPGTQPDGNQVAWLTEYLTKDTSRSSPSVIRKSLLFTCSNTAALNVPLKKHVEIRSAVYRFPCCCIYVIKKEEEALALE